MARAGDRYAQTSRQSYSACEAVSFGVSRTATGKWTMRRRPAGLLNWALALRLQRIS